MEFSTVFCQDLRRDIERLRKEFTDLQTVSLEPPSPYGSPADPTPTEEQQLDVLSETPGNLNSPAVGKPHLNIPESEMNATWASWTLFLEK